MRRIAKYLKPYLWQIAAVLALVFVQAMTDLQILPIDEAKKAAQPGIVGYVVQKGDSMWSIAKKYYASIDAIKQLNNLESDYVSEGDRLLIVKS